MCGDVFYVLVYVDLVIDYLFYWGYVDEIGVGVGWGMILNLLLLYGIMMVVFCVV